MIFEVFLPKLLCNQVFNWCSVKIYIFITVLHNKKKIPIINLARMVSVHNLQQWIKAIIKTCRYCCHVPLLFQVCQRHHLYCIGQTLSKI